MKQIFLLSALMSTLFISACGSGSGSFPTDKNVAARGVVYPVVEGLSYKTNSSSGIVSSDGSYSYNSNENVTFSAGGIELATVPAAAQVTPLPLDNDVASTNLLRLLKALDIDGNLSNGISLSPLATSSLTSVDLTDEASVAAALTSLAPAATLPAASDEQVATALTDAKTTAIQSMGTYGSTYEAIKVTQLNGVQLPGYPKDAVVRLTSQPNWTTGAITGTATLTLNDNSTITLPFNNATGNYTASGSTFDYGFSVSYGAKSRIVFLDIGLATTPSTGKSVRIVLRDNSKPNMPPVPSVGRIIDVVFPPVPGPPRTFNFTSIPTGPGSIFEGSKDFDGFVVSQTWESSKGKKGTGNNFSEDFYYNEEGSVTVTVRDDEGATASKTWQNSGTTTTAGPTVTGMNPNVGASGTTITITGTNFSITPANNIVKFNGTQATVTAATATSLTVTVPSGATTGTVSVTTTGGTTTSASSFTVTTTASSGSLTLSTPINGVSSFNLDWPDFLDLPLTSSSAIYWVSDEIDITAGDSLIFSPNIYLGISIYFKSIDKFGSVTCVTAGSVGSFPTCASVGITFNKSTGTLTFVNTPTDDGETIYYKNNLTGTLHFTPY